MYSSTTLLDIVLDIPVLYMYNCEKKTTVIFFFGGGGVQALSCISGNLEKFFERGCRAAGGCRTYVLS